MLFSFTPLRGPRAGHIYYLPPHPGPYDAGGSIVDHMVDSQMADGQIPTLGSDRGFFGPGLITVTFDFLGIWLDTLGSGGNSPVTMYGATLAGRDTAIWDFAQHVLMGGEGSLVDHPFPGGKNPLTGTTVTTLTAGAYVVGDYKSSRMIRGSFDVTFKIPSGFWLTNNNEMLPVV